jgi:hypothetical protein
MASRTTPAATDWSSTAEVGRPSVTVRAEDQRRGFSVPAGFQNAPRSAAAAARASNATEDLLHLVDRLDPPHDDIGIRVAGQQRRLEENEARCPDGCRASEPRQDLLGDDRLNEEQQERTCENRQREQAHVLMADAIVGSPPQDSADAHSRARRLGRAGRAATAFRRVPVRERDRQSDRRARPEIFDAVDRPDLDLRDVQALQHLSGTSSPAWRRFHTRS